MGHRLCYHPNFNSFPVEKHILPPPGGFASLATGRTGCPWANGRRRGEQGTGLAPLAPWQSGAWEQGCSAATWPQQRLRGRAGKAPPPCQSHRGVPGKCGVLGMGGSTLLGSGTRGKSKLEADCSPPGEDGSLRIAQSPTKQGSEGERRRRRGGKKKGKKREEERGGKRQENPNSHPGRDLKGQRQLSAPPSRTPKTSLLSSPHWHLSAAQTHTQEPLLRVRSGLRPCLPRGSTEGRRARGSGRGRILLSPTALCPCKAQHRPTRAPAPAIPAGCPRRDRATRPPLTQLPTTQMSSVAV